MSVRDRITARPDVHFGKPCVAGTRIPVKDVLELVKEGRSFDEILRDYYPELEREDVVACIEYAMEVIGVEDIHVSRGAA